MLGPDIAFLYDVYGLCNPKELTPEVRLLHNLCREIFEEVTDGGSRDISS